MDHEPDLSGLQTRIPKKLKFEPKQFMLGSSAKQLTVKTFTYMLVQEKQEATKNFGFLLLN